MAWRYSRWCKWPHVCFSVRAFAWAWLVITWINAYVRELVSISLSESIIMWMRKIHRRGKKHIFTHIYIRNTPEHLTYIHQYCAERNHVKLFMDCRICIIPFFCIRPHLPLALSPLVRFHPDSLSVHPAALTFALNFKIYLLCHINLVARTMLTSQRIAHELNLFHEMTVCIFALSSYAECDGFGFQQCNFGCSKFGCG